MDKVAKIIWRIKFAFATKKIFSKPKGAFTGRKFFLGWKVSGKVYEKYKNKKPWDAALEEISEWYS